MVGLAQGGETCATAVAVGEGEHFAWPQTGGGYVATGCPGWLATNASWFAYTPTITGMVTISSCDNLFGDGADTRLSVLVGQCGALQTIGCADDECWLDVFDPFAASRLQLFVTAGITYYIQWDDSHTNHWFYWKLIECVGTGNGTTYTDQDGDGVHDSGEPTRAVLLHAAPENEVFYSGGDYTHCSDIGDHTITVVDPPPHHTQTISSQAYTIAAPNDVVSGLDFAFVPIPGIHDAEAAITHNIAWIGQQSSIGCQVRNIGTEIIHPVVTLTLDPHQTMVAPHNPAPTSVTGQQLQWTLPPMAPGEQQYLGCTLLTDNATPPGTVVTSQVSISIAENDVDQTNNTDFEHSLAFVSCDPNYKEVSATVITPEQVAAQEPLTYTIHFQNTGTAPAVNIVVVDTLDADLDVSTFTMLGSSHANVVSFTDGVLSWAFPNIMLPDSGADLQASQGDITFRIAPKNNLILGDQLMDRADIFFDFNAAVPTNAPVTTVQLESGLPEPGLGNALTIAPSPTTGLVTVSWSNAALNNATFTVLDALGRTLHATPRRMGNGASQCIDLSSLPAGSYVARLSNASSATWTRFVVQR